MPRYGHVVQDPARSPRGLALGGTFDLDVGLGVRHRGLPADRSGMKWQSVVVASLVCGLVSAQTPATPPGGVKPVPEKSAKPTKSGRARVLERAKSMRKGISTGQQVKSHVRVRVRLRNGNRLTGVVKDGRLVERVDGLRFVDALALDTGAGIRLWYSGGTQSYVFIPFASLKSYEVVQRLSQEQLLAIENEMQMSAKRQKEQQARAQQQAKGPAPTTLPDPVPGQLPGEAGVAGRMAALRALGKPGQAVPAKPAGIATTVSGQAGSGGTAAVTTKPAAEQAAPVTAGEAARELEQARQELAWANLLRTYPPKDGWNEAKKNEIARRQVVVGALPTKLELAFVASFDQWIQACEHNGVDPNAAVVKKPQTKRERRRAERDRVRGK